jgi:RNA polymerase sigma factor (sigma-70 family)
MSTSRDASLTRQSLLIRLKDPGNDQAWEEFHRQYAPMIRGWCHQWFPRETDDMVQEVFVRLAHCLKTFEYQPSQGRFRGYLKTVTHNLMAKLDRRVFPQADDDQDPFDSVEASEDLAARLAAEFDLELLEIAKDRVRGRVQPQTWAAYLATAEEQRAPAEVARELGMKVGTVFQAKHSVITQLRREIESLQGPA